MEILRLRIVDTHKFIRSMVVLFLIVCAIFMVGFKSTSAADSNYDKHFITITVSSEDTLWNIADTYVKPEVESYNDYIDEVKEINHITGDNIVVGDHLLVPYYTEK